MQNMDFYYDFSGQKFDYPLSLSINSFSRNTFSKQSSLEISYVLQGNYEVVTAHISQILKEKEMVVIAPNEIHMLRPVQDGIILTIHIDFSRMNASMAGKYKERFNTDVYHMQRNRKAYIHLRNKMGELVKELMDEHQDLYHMNAIMMEILYITSSSVSFDLPLHTDHHANYMKAIQYIDAHFSEDITLSQIAQQLSFSPSYASKLMKKYMGIPFVKYLAQVRIRASLESLLEGRESIEKIAFECGMPNSKAYTVAFKELYGILPSAYRKQFQQNMKYSATDEKQKMVLDKDQKALLQHLVDEEIIYEEDSIEITKESKEMIIKVSDSQLKIETAPDGEMIIKIVFP